MAHFLPTGEGVTGEVVKTVDVGYTAKGLRLCSERYLTAQRQPIGVTLTPNGANYTLDFGTRQSGSDTISVDLALLNTLLGTDAAYQDNLGGTFAFQNPASDNPFAALNLSSLNVVAGITSLIPVRLRLTRTPCQGYKRLRWSTRPRASTRRLATRLSRRSPSPSRCNILTSGNTGIWTASQSGSWGDSTKWKDGTIPDSQGRQREVCHSRRWNERNGHS